MRISHARFVAYALLAVFSVECGLVYVMWTIRPALGKSSPPKAGPAVEQIVIKAFGDVNLGRLVGERILAGDTLYPFAHVADLLDSADVVFVNLESQLSDQDGETQDPRSNIVFTGPPEGARTLALAGITLVSTANNHAFDYGKHALAETISSLDGAGILHAGTSTLPAQLYEPCLFSSKGIRVAFFAVTGIMNWRHGWHGFVAVADTALLFPKIRETRTRADVIILSFHGGVEYADSPTASVYAFAHQAVAQGVTIFLGHHPHVPYGIEHDGNSYIVYSLGNFVFSQPQRFWTRRSYGAEFEVTKEEGRTNTTLKRVLPLNASLQPEPMVDTFGLASLRERMVRTAQRDFYSLRKTTRQ